MRARGTDKVTVLDEREPVPRREVVAAFEETLQRVEQGEIAEAVEEFGDARALGQRAALLAFTGISWKRHLGPSFSKTEVAQLLGVTRDAVRKRMKTRRLFALPTGERDYAFPAFQFDESGHPYPVLSAVLTVFAEVQVEPHTLASWFKTPQNLLEDETPATWMANYRDPEVLVAAARRTAARLAH